MNSTSADSAPVGDGRAALANIGAALIASSVVVFVDQLTKSLAQHYLRNRPIHVLGPLSLHLVYNSGVAFSLGTGHPAVVVALAFVLIALLVFAVSRVRSLAMAVAFGLVLGGALGNLADRLFRPLGGAVVDFIATGVWPTFNVADASIVFGCVVVGIQSLRRQ